MNNFLRKVRRFIGYVPFVKDAVVMYFCMVDPHTPMTVKAMIAGSLTYFLSPMDAIPDVLGAVGFTDDAGVISSTLVAVTAHIKEEHCQKADEFFAHAD